MAENTKTPPNQDQRQRTPQGSDAGKQQKPGGSVPSSNPDRSRQGQGQGMNNPNKPEIDPDRGRQGVNQPEIGPDRDQQNRGSGKPMPGKPGVDNDIDEVEDIDDDESTQRMDRE
jgi:hypothetical protein